MKLPFKGGDFEATPAGNHVARLYSIIDIGLQDGGQYEDKRKIVLTFELGNELMKDGRPFAISQFFTASLHEKAGLCLALEAIAGRKLPEEKKATFDMRTMLGIPCMLNVVHETGGDGKVRAKIKGFGQLPKGLEAPALVNEKVFYDLDAPDKAVYDSLPDWIKKLVDGRVDGAGSLANPDIADDDIPFG